MANSLQDFLKDFWDDLQVEELKDHALTNGIEAAKNFAIKNGLSRQMANQLEDLLKEAVSEAITPASSKKA